MTLPNDLDPLGPLAPLQPMLEMLRLRQSEVAGFMVGSYVVATNRASKEVYLAGIDAANREWAMRMQAEELAALISKLQDALKTISLGPIDSR